jgi:predicted unusual protein kinase regulating ubiquinone biosynthesis (AarF/ABC1/UbiB family)
MATLETLRQHIQDNIEDTHTPQQIINILKPYNGKPLTKIHIDKINQQLVPTIDQKPVKLNKRYTMTHLTWEKDGIEHRLLISYDTKNITIDTDDIITKNPSHFQAAQIRNQEREEILKNEQLLQELANTIDQYTEAKHKLDKFFSYESPFRADRTSIQQQFIE